jgi:hypothetical protein
MELAHPLRLLGEIATQFSDLAFHHIRQFDGSRLLVFAQPATCDCGLRHSISSYAAS